MMDTLIRLAESWWPFYAVHLFETSLFVLLVLAVDRWVRLDTHLRYLLWLCALVKVFVPPFYALPLPSFLFGTPEPIAHLDTFTEPVLLATSVDFAPIELPPEPIPIAFWIFAIWSFSVFAFVGVTLWRNRIFQRALGIANPVHLSSDLDDLTQGANLKVFSKVNLNSPLLVGVVKPRLYLPSSWQAWTPTQLRGIVAHELAHYHNRDLWALVFQVLATVLFGLNPLTWLVNRRLAHLRELRCDEDALRKSGISPVEYGKLLYAFLDANAHPGLPALGFNEKDTPLKKRFEHVLNFKGGDMKRTKWQLVVPVLVALAIVPFSIRETYSQSTAQPFEIQNLAQEFVGKGSYGMMFKKRTLDTKLDLIEVTAPDYPKALLRQGIEGQVELVLVVGSDGRVEQVTRIGGDERFEKSAINALNKARFRPSNNGQSTRLKQTVLFRLKDDNVLVIELPKTFWKGSDLGEMVVWAKSSNTDEGVTNLQIKPTKQIPSRYPENLRVNGDEEHMLMERATQKQTSAEPHEGDFNHMLQVHEVDERPYAVRVITPEYPTEAKAKGLNGKVFVNAVVNTDGTLSDVKVLRGDEIFRQSALDAVNKMRFRPAKHQGQNVPVRLILPIDFQMKSPQVSNSQSFEANVGFVSKPPKNIPHILINTQGQVLLDFSKSVSLDALGNELAQLKQEKKVQTIRVQPDEKTPMAYVQKVLDTASRAGLAVEIFNASEESTKPKRALDPNNLQFYQVSVKPKVIQTARPVYPKIARKAGLTGKVFLKFRVNIDGSVSDVTVLRGQQIFRESAIEAIQKFRFQPAEHEGKPVAVWMTQPVSFRLGKGELVRDTKKQAVNLGAFLIKVPAGMDDRATIQPQLILNATSIEASDILSSQLPKAQQLVSEYLSDIPLEHWKSSEKRAVIMNGIETQINKGFGSPLVSHVSFAGVSVDPFLMDGNHQFKLHSNFPNPFNPETSIKYEVAEPVFVRMEIFNITGQVIRTLVTKDHSPGQYEIRWDGKNDQGNSVASGVYYYHIKAGSFNAVNKMQLVK